MDFILLFDLLLVVVLGLLERWQTGHLPVYAAWAWIVVLVFPPLFNYA